MKYGLRSLLIGAFIFVSQVPLIELIFPSILKSNEINSAIDSNYLKQTPSTSYILGPGDVLNIEFKNINIELEDSFNYSFTIDSEGMANLKRLNKIFVSGLTVTELTTLLNKEFKKYLINPSVKLTIAKFRPVKFYIDGEVINPGMHILPGQLTVEETININKESKFEDSPSYSDTKMGINNYFFPTVIDAIRESGGISMYSDLRRVKITRKENLTKGGGRITTQLDLLGVLDLTDTSQNIRIFDGDTIFIEKNSIPVVAEISKAYKSNINPKQIQVSIGGRVEVQNSLLTLGKSSSVNDAILTSGGAKFFKGNVTLLRYKSDGSAERRDFAYRKNAKNMQQIYISCAFFPCFN